MVLFYETLQYTLPLRHLYNKYFLVRIVATISVVDCKLKTYIYI